MVFAHRGNVRNTRQCAHRSPNACKQQLPKQPFRRDGSLIVILSPLERLQHISRRDRRNAIFLPRPAERSPRPSSSWCSRQPGNACRRAAGSCRPAPSRRSRKRNRPVACATEPWPPGAEVAWPSLHDALKRDRIERLQIRCCLRRPANGARYSNHYAQCSRCHG
jgi:hypothetical protein